MISKCTLVNYNDFRLKCDPKAQQFEPFLAELEELRLIYCDTINIGENTMTNQLEKTDVPIHVSEQINKVHQYGHSLLLTNEKDYKSYLMDEGAYSNEIGELLQSLTEMMDTQDQSRILALLIELDVADPSRIGNLLLIL